MKLFYALITSFSLLCSSFALSNSSRFNELKVKDFNSAFDLTRFVNKQRNLKIVQLESIVVRNRVIERIWFLVDGFNDRRDEREVPRRGIDGFFSESSDSVE